MPANRHSNLPLQLHLHPHLPKDRISELTAILEAVLTVLQKLTTLTPMRPSELAPGRNSCDACVEMEDEQLTSRVTDLKAESVPAVRIVKREANSFRGLGQRTETESQDIVQ